jgi:dipeptide/tripeptide permease
MNTPMPINLTLQVSELEIENFFNCIALFMFFTPFYINDLSLILIQISLTGTISSSIYLPNAFYQAFNSIVIIILIPILLNLIYPYLLKINKLPSSRMKIIIGFTITSIGSLLGAFF